MSLIAPPRPSPASLDAGVIDDAKRRRDRRRGIIAFLTTVTILAGITYLAGGGSGGRGPGVPQTAGGEVPRASAGNGISLSYPPGWKLYAPPITSISYPLDRLLLTSFPAATGGGCSPTRAENALPPSGALIYVFEYGTARAASLTHDVAAAPPKPAAFALNARDLGNYECWGVPTYLIRFRAAGRRFQIHVALGAHVTPARRAQVLRILDSLRFQSLAKPSSR